jgi:hydroxymethylglutaryl-CoA synthase
MTKEHMNQPKTAVGISGMSLYVPPLCVNLEDWCAWTGQPWEKVRNVVGESFRYPAPDENVYTMAATAVLRLIEAYDIDPRQVGFLALGTESSTDNAAGAIIVRGMLDRALEERGRPRLARDCEVPEYKHACLGGIYALKGAVRYLRCDGAGRKAIVVCGDVAEYERGSSGEQTQGAGAVAMLVDEDARLVTIDLSASASASDYRGPDFRKPFARHFAADYAPNVHRLHDFPVFSGKYSTYAYLDETCQVVDRLVERLATEPLTLFEESRAIFFHRPYRHMPIRAMAALYVRALARSPTRRAEVEALCEQADVSADALLRECAEEPDLFAGVEKGSDADPHPVTAAVASVLRKTEAFRDLVADKLGLGAERAMHLGNLYTAALPAWLAAGLEEAAAQGVELASERLLAIGYGSGDAAEALTLYVSPEWRDAAAKIGIAEALQHPSVLTREQYEALHDRNDASSIAPPVAERFVITRVGDRHEATFQDLGVEYYALEAS